jgi:DNA-binding transcriptional LysR family regulator
MRSDPQLVSTRLAYFAAVAEAGSVRGAARQLNIASSAVNRQLLMLEDALGQPLFERTGRAMRLTQAGQLLLEQVRAAARDFEDTVAAMDALKGLRAGKVRVATVESVSVEMLPALLTGFNEAFPGIEIELNVAGSDAVTARVLAREADIGFTFNPTSLDGLEVAYQKDMQIGAVVSPDHPLCALKKVRLADCLAYPHAWPARGLSLRTALDAGLAKSDAHLAPVLECNSLRVMSALARQGRCVAFQTPVGVEQHLASGALKFLPLKDKAVPPDCYMIVRQAGRALGPAAGAFFGYVLLHAKSVR